MRKVADVTKVGHFRGSADVRVHHHGADDNRGRRPSGGAVERIGGVLATISLWVQIVCLVALVVLVVVAVALRYGVDYSLIFEDAAIQLLFVWIIFAGLGRAVWTDNLLHLSMWQGRKNLAADYIEGLGHGVLLAFIALLVYSTVSSAPAYFTTTIAQLPVSSLAVSLPIGAGAVVAAAVLVARLWVEGAHWQVYATSLVVAGSAWAVVAYGVVGGVWVLVGLVALILLDVPIVAAIGLCGQLLVAGGHLSTAIPIVVGQELNSVQDVAFIALPLFMLLGGLVAKTGLAADLGRFLRALLGPLPGGVGLSCVAAAGVLANMTGSPIADTATLGSVFIPEMEKVGYSKPDAAALQACAGLLGLVFPPAIVLIIWATIANTSVTAQFAAILVPGGMLMVTMMAVVVIRATVTDRYGGRDRPGAGEWVGGVARSVGSAGAVLVIPVILDVGIFTGVFAAYEAGAVALVVASGMGAARRRIRLRDWLPVFTQAVDTTVLVMVILGSVGVLEYGLFTSGLDSYVGRILAVVAGSVLGFWVVVNLAFMILHEFVEPIPAILLLSPFIIPLAVTLHVSLVQLGAVIVVNSTIGLVLPPLGINLYVASKMAGVESTEVLRRVWPYLLGSVVVLGLVSAIPALTAL